MPAWRSRSKNDGGVAIRSDGIVDDPDADASACLVNEEIGQTPAVELDILESKIFELERLLGAIYRREHRGEGFRSVAQQLDLVAGDQRSVHQSLLERNMAVQHAAFRVLAFHAFKDRLALRVRERAARTDDPHPAAARRIDQRVDLRLGRTCRDAQREGAGSNELKALGPIQPTCTDHEEVERGAPIAQTDK